MSELCRVNWYRLLDDRPPMLITGGLVMNTRMPGHRGQLPGERLGHLVGAQRRAGRGP